ncbi:TonB-dependent receptor [Craterilacuibacter sp. RT1T]|uniref:TonB-dependent receptor plug domain-containing protein n=1 Tax=Craterilacuibacter sp. RT1T TaxID=2942211 RepID=UPI0020BDEF79|nr:TonB-dependent receptor [Craterilacuibacter sp. RT1T]MCL6264656.1 TonB-dependent receptor [Craterilacuibacter sp. RT1T]
MSKRKVWPQLGLLGMLACTPLTASYAADSHDQGNLLAGSLEDLLATEVVGASKSRQLIAEAPANVTIITAEDIRRYGYRTLAQALSRVAGLQVSVGYQTASVASRGSSANQFYDWNSRLLLMIDGHRMNDGLFDQALLSYDSIVDLQTVERIEFIKGPGAAMYGGNALFGVVNVITKRGKAVDGAELWARGSRGEGSAGGLAGGVLPGGQQWLFSASREQQPRLSTQVLGNVQPGLGLFDNHYSAGQSKDSLFAKLDGANYSLVAAASRWQLDVARLQRPHFAMPEHALNATQEGEQYLLGGQGRWALGEQTELTALFNVARHRIRMDQRGGFLHPAAPQMRASMRDGNTWNGAELRLTSEAFAGQRWVGGLEWRKDHPRARHEQWVVSDGFQLETSGQGGRSSIGVYVQDELTLADNWLLTLGGRVDKVSHYGAQASPRAALIYTPSASTTVKLMHGEAFRSPNQYEYDDTFLVNGNPGPYAGQRPGLEKASNDELLIEYRSGFFSGTASVYHSRIRDMITFLPLWEDPSQWHTENLGPVTTRGVELSATWRDPQGAGAYASVSQQRSRDQAGRWPGNTAEWTASAGVDARWFGKRLEAALEWQAMSARRTMDQTAPRLPGYCVANLNVLARPWSKQIELNLQVLNLFDRDFLLPAMGSALGARGREAWLGLRYTL